jgi:hypothetical protein
VLQELGAQKELLAADATELQKQRFARSRRELAEHD